MTVKIPVRLGRSRSAKRVRQGIDPSESQILNAVMDWLAAERVWHRRWNAGATKFGDRWVRFGQKGDGDVIAVKKGRIVWIELKTITGKQSIYQKVFQQEVEEQGMIYILARSIDELISAFRAI